VLEYVARWKVVIPPDRDDLICHHDLAPWNLVTGADRWVFIDWDGAGPGSRLWDLAYAVKGFVPLEGGGDPAADGPRLRALADGYGLTASQRRRLPPLIGAHTRGMAHLLENAERTGEQPWARLFAEGRQVRRSGACGTQAPVDGARGPRTRAAGPLPSAAAKIILCMARIMAAQSLGPERTGHVALAAGHRTDRLESGGVRVGLVSDRPDMKWRLRADAVPAETLDGVAAMRTLLGGSLIRKAKARHVAPKAGLSGRRS